MCILDYHFPYDQYSQEQLNLATLFANLSGRFANHLKYRDKNIMFANWAQVILLNRARFFHFLFAIFITLKR